MNPNKTGAVLTTDPFEFGIMNGITLMEYASNYPGVTIEGAPKLLDLISVAASNPYANWDTDYVFYFRTL
jgi:hypothetical protein